MPLERRTLAILRSAELGFLGVAVLTAVHTPLFCGEDSLMGLFFRELNPLWSAGAPDFFTEVCLPFLTSWLKVGIVFLLSRKIISLKNPLNTGLLGLFVTGRAAQGVLGPHKVKF